MLDNLNSPILRINAKHSIGSENYPDKIAQNLTAVLYLARGAKIMILSNIITSLGLVNGANRIIKDFIYTDGDKAPQLPYAIIIECNETPFSRLTPRGNSLDGS